MYCHDRNEESADEYEMDSIHNAVEQVRPTMKKPLGQFPWKEIYGHRSLESRSPSEIFIRLLLLVNLLDLKRILQVLFLFFCGRSNGM